MEAESAERSWPRQNDGYGERNPGTQRMIDELGGGQPAESLAVDPPRLARPPRAPRRRVHVRDFESDRDAQLAAERADYRPSTPEERAATGEYVPQLRATLAQLTERAIVEASRSSGDRDFASSDQEAKDAALARARIRARREDRDK